MKNILLISVIALALAGCNDEEVHDVQYYVDNTEARIAKLAECDNNPGEKAADANCVNASRAETQAMFKGSGMPSIK